MFRIAAAALALLGCTSCLTAIEPEPTARVQTERAYAAAAAAGEAPCREAIGRGAALALVRYCREVSSATHPPCNTGNYCVLIVEHIRGMCSTSPDEPLPCGSSFKASDWKRISLRPAL